jgi:TetR/AcrR family transcriptional regulator, transcriptional repressor for nem operon
MPRTKEFDPSRALERAMQVFWQQGYHATSMDDLVAALGVQRYGIYTTFKNKQSLFLAALDHYLDTVVGSLLQEMAQPGAGLAALRSYFDQLVAIAHTPAGLYGCLMCNTAIELAPHDPATAQKVNAFLARLHGTFRGAVATAQQRGDLPAAITPDDAARYLTGIVLGLNVYVKTPVDRQHIDAYIRVALAAIGAPPIIHR